MSSGDGGGDDDGDEELIRRLAGQPQDSPEWCVFRLRFLGVTAGALHAAILSPTPVRTFGSAGFRVLGSLDQARLRRDRDLRTELVADAVIRAYDAFVEKLELDQGWRPGGASLDNYAIRGALHHLADVVKRWRRAQKAAALRLVDGDPVDLPHPAVAGPENGVVDAAYACLVADLLEERDPLVARAVRLHVETEEGWGRIARRLGVSPSTLRTRRTNASTYLRWMLEERGEGHGQL